MLPRKTIPAKTEIDMFAGNSESPTRLRHRDVNYGAFTLIELFVTMSVIIVLVGLAFPAFTAVQNSARKTQAKNDLVQIVTAVNAFYTEYGKYPTAAPTDAAAKVGPGGGSTNAALLTELRAVSGATMNTRQIVFMSPPDAKDQAAPRGGMSADGQLIDPWGTAYAVTMDADYDNQIANLYTADTGGGATRIRQGVIAWSLGKDKSGGSGAKNTGLGADDVISWQ